MLIAMMLLTLSIVIALCEWAHRSPVTATDDACARVDAELDEPGAVGRMAA